MASLIPSAGGTGTGSCTLQGPSTNSNQTITLPDATGTVMVSGNMPAFSAYGSANQNFTSGVSTKITLDTEVFDTNSNFASSRFTPTVAGYYQINAIARITDTVALSSGQVLIFKNGSQINSGVLISTGLPISTLSTLILMNGTTDYIELYGYGAGTAPYFQFANASACCSMSGCLVRTT